MIFLKPQPQQKEDVKISIEISIDLYRELEQVIREGGFSSVEDYVNYVLHLHVGKNSERNSGQDKEALSVKDTEIVTSRLKALGYI